MDKIRKIREARQRSRHGISGQAMDRRVEKKRSYGRYGLYAAGGMAVLLFAWWFVDMLAGGRSLSVNSQRITRHP